MMLIRTNQEIGELVHDANFNNKPCLRKINIEDIDKIELKDLQLIPHLGHDDSQQIMLTLIINKILKSK